MAVPPPYCPFVEVRLWNWRGPASAEGGRRRPRYSMSDLRPFRPFRRQTSASHGKPLRWRAALVAVGGKQALLLPLVLAWPHHDVEAGRSRNEQMTDEDIEGNRCSRATSLLAARGGSVRNGILLQQPARLFARWAAALRTRACRRRTSRRNAREIAGWDGSFSRPSSSRQSRGKARHGLRRRRWP